jgi:hypothetical protein
MADSNGQSSDLDTIVGRIQTPVDTQPLASYSSFEATGFAKDREVEVIVGFVAICAFDSVVSRVPIESCKDHTHGYLAAPCDVRSATMN